MLTTKITVVVLIEGDTFQFQVCAHKAINPQVWRITRDNLREIKQEIDRWFPERTA
jgi:hypothetical protein